ncbi:hypothetical protein CMQ_831 [Grosmannia clavigera kw1407]|uniref:Uncharacterized protein n=1 Tax=Grosmannia clavigera (strain kw1407 / UAMH 11150) TaxID=655863 RepID=F0XBW8_GROCL|nr:uncharacterized protein CMQ_831 [Grosmannia clavigera kw1407]EFX03903.1 hypothetical protein CMQ_831 [Grosmannia clavigera kw1407]
MAPVKGGRYSAGSLEERTGGQTTQHSSESKEALSEQRVRRRDGRPGPPSRLRRRNPDSNSNGDVSAALSSVAADSITTSSISGFFTPSSTRSSTAIAVASSRANGADSDRNGAQQLTLQPAIVAAPSVTSAEVLAPAVTTIVLATIVTGPTTLLKSTLVATVSASSSSASDSAMTSILTSSDRRHKTASTDSDSDDTSSNSKGNSSRWSSHRSDDKPLSQSAERALISAGSIGAFIIVCFLFWLVWRAVHNQNWRKHAGALATAAVFAGSPASPSAAVAIHSTSNSATTPPRRLFKSITSRMPFFGRRTRTWQTLEDNTSKETNATVGTKNLGPSQQPAEVYQEKITNIVSSSEGLPATPSQVYHGDDLSQQKEQQQRQKYAAAASTAPSFIYSQQMAVTSANLLAVSPYGAAEASAGPTAEAAYLRAGNGTLINSDGVSSMGDTLRSRMPDPYYNQSQLARQPSDAYDPMHRQVNRISELSSLSSGFGDGEIVDLELPPKRQQQMLSVPPMPSTPLAVTLAGAGHFSWMRASRFVPNSRRETVYTEAGEDQPARFRSVTSWVHQQTGRVRRAQQRSNANNNPAAGGPLGTTGATNVQSGRANMSAESEMPATPGIARPMPEEQRLTMMVDDGEEPRRPETVPGIHMKPR